MDVELNVVYVILFRHLSMVVKLFVKNIIVQAYSMSISWLELNTILHV